MPGEIQPLGRLALRKCPFCGEDDFDAWGLKHHLRSGWCEAFDNIDDDDRLEGARAIAPVTMVLGEGQ